jgi:hypothetical protein
MDDFRVGSVSTSDPYGQHQPSGSNARKRKKTQDDESGQQQDDPADSFETVEARDDEAGTAEEPGQDYYLPSNPPADAG